MNQLARRQGIPFRDFTIPWERRTEPFKALWIANTFRKRGLKLHATTLRIGSDQVSRYNSSPYGFIGAFSRELNLAVDLDATPYFCVVELKDGNGDHEPHFHALFGLPRDADRRGEADPRKLDEVKAELLGMCGDFYKPRALCMTHAYLPSGWVQYLGKQAEFTERTTGRSAFYFPRPLLQAGRDLYDEFRADMRH